jgi:hypothetical protein
MSEEQANAIPSWTSPADIPNTQSVLDVLPAGDTPIVGNIAISIAIQTTLYIFFTGGDGVEVRYGEEGHRPETPLKPGVSSFNYKPPNQFSLQYISMPHGQRFKLVWGYNL